jgi:hypothetical protein
MCSMSFSQLQCFGLIMFKNNLFLLMYPCWFLVYMGWLAFARHVDLFFRCAHWASTRLLISLLHGLDWFSMYC